VHIVGLGARTYFGHSALAEHDGRCVFVTSGDGYAYQSVAFPTVYRLAIPD